MPDPKKFSELAAVTSLEAGDLFALARSGANKKITRANLAADLLGGLSLGTMASENASDYLTKAGNLSGLASVATARSNLGLNSMAQQAASSVTITGGTISGVTFNSGFNVSGTVTATAFVGNGAGLTGIGSGTGGVINTGSTTIGADSDSDGVGIISLQTRGVERFQVGNTGLLGIGAPSTGAIVHIDRAAPKPPAGSGTYANEEYWLFTNADAGNPDWSLNVHHSFQDNAPASHRPYHSFGFGYNLPTSPNYVLSDHVVGWWIETPYISGVGTEQAEIYLALQGRPGVTANPSAIRPWSVNFHLEDNYCDGGWRANAIYFGYQDFNNDWLVLTSSEDEGRMIFRGNAAIRVGVDGVGVTPEWLVDYEGEGGVIGFHVGRNEAVLGQSHGHLRLAGDGVSSDPIYLRAGSLLEGAMGALRFGRGGGEVPFGWQFSNNNSDYHAFNPLMRMYHLEDGYQPNTRLGLGWGRVGVGAFSGSSGINATVHIKPGDEDATPLLVQAGASETFKVAYSGAVHVWDGSLKLISFGPDDSGGTGFRALRVPN